MKSNVLKFVLAASLVLNVTIFATAGYRYYMQSRMWVSPFGKVMEKDKFLFEELSLKPGQMAAMKKESMLFRAEIDKRRQELVAKRKALVALMRLPNHDVKAVNTVIGEISGKQEEMQRMVAGHMLKIKTSLNAEQQVKFFDLIETNMTDGGQMACPPGQGRM